MRCRRLEHRFLPTFPDRLEPGILYVSMEFGTASHSCCCGCGEEVVTPFTPSGWKMTYDGETVSVWPSVGSWTLRCRSHYVIDRGRVVEAGDWNDAHAAEARHWDNPVAAVAAPPPATALPPPQPTSVPAAEDGNVSGWWARFRRWLATWRR